MKNLWYNKHRNNYIYSLPQSHKSKYNKKGVDIMIGIYAIRNTNNNTSRYFLYQLGVT